MIKVSYTKHPGRPKICRDTYLFTGRQLLTNHNFSVKCANPYAGAFVASRQMLTDNSVRGIIFLQTQERSTHMKEKQHKIKDALSRVPIWLVFVITIGIGVGSWYCAKQFLAPLMIAHMILGVLYAAGGILFLYLCRHKCGWNLLPAAVGIFTALFSMLLSISYLCDSTAVLGSIIGGIWSFSALPCMLFYAPLMMYVILVLGTVPISGCIIMTILGILLTVYCIRNIVKNIDKSESRPADEPEAETTENQAT